MIHNQSINQLVPVNQYFKSWTNEDSNIVSKAGIGIITTHMIIYYSLQQNLSLLH